MDAGLILSLLSLALSIFFWWNAKQQSDAASRTLQDIKTQIIGWQNELNKASIDLLSSRPEMIAKQAALSEAKAGLDFALAMAATVQTLAAEDSDKNRALIESILKHHETIVLERQRMGFNAAMGGSTHSPRPEG
ncbi:MULTISPECIES: hypothetical protein [unclassified Pseudoxanthomonas]|uniref:hypothetical protein n=1 Tax=unclassified Pseudoxanthomonas TaxID=2645906 RepID=UPI00161A842B|nr:MULTISPECIES: hypothetical protein [unclassified Pseudoxanthomonas]MBB3274277.1 hypothetical protein [Pseudoxanthomonas sp. OG2]MBV7474786.1 hypothetical protein [Pseudoxanthomonas sp. PXM05]